jgi:hypothetical protein
MRTTEYDIRVSLPSNRRQNSRNDRGSTRSENKGWSCPVAKRNASNPEALFNGANELADLNLFTKSRAGSLEAISCGRDGTRSVLCPLSGPARAVRFLQRAAMTAQFQHAGRNDNGSAEWSGSDRVPASSDRHDDARSSASIVGTLMKRLVMDDESAAGTTAGLIHRGFDDRSSTRPDVYLGQLRLKVRHA